MHFRSFTSSLRLPRRTLRALAGPGLGLALTLGCASYPDHVQRAARAVEEGKLAAGVHEMSRAARVKGADEVPGAVSGRDAGLAMLERGTLLHAMQRWDDSSRDLGLASGSLVVLDRARAPAPELGEALYGLPVRPYALTPTEEIHLAALDLLNRLARGDLRAARDAARTFTIARRKLHDARPGVELAPYGSYLAGFVMEKLEETDLAVAYYEEALGARDLPSLIAPLGQLTLRSTYRGARTTAYALDPDADVTSMNGGEVLVVVLTGRAPGRAVEEVPVATALAEAGDLADGLAPAVRGTGVKTVAYPGVQPAGNRAVEARLRVDGKDIRLDAAGEPGREIVAEHDAARPHVLAAALDRVARGLRADRPDTRSWTMLPDRVHVSRVRMPAGPHTVEVETGGPQLSRWHRRDVRVEAGGYQVVVVTALE